MPRYSPTAVHVHYRGAVDRPVPRCSAFASGIDALMLYQDHGVSSCSSDSLGVDGALKIPGFLVRNVTHAQAKVEDLHSVKANPVSPEQFPTIRKWSCG